MIGTPKLTQQPAAALSPLRSRGDAAPARGEFASPPGKLVITLVSIYVFLIVSRVLDLSPIWWMRIPLMLFIVLCIMTLAHGNFRRSFSSKITRLFFLLTAWIVICYPFSTWRGGSMQYEQMAVQSFIIYLIIVQAVKTEADWNRLAGGYAYAALAAGLYGFYAARFVDGRLTLLGGTFGDPNVFALSLLVGLPFWWYKASRAAGLRKMFCWACTLPIFISFVRAGSRGGLLAFTGLFVVMFFLGDAGRKFLIVMGVLLGLTAAVAFLPPYLKARYLTIFQPHETSGLSANAAEQLNSDIESSEEREQLLFDSIHLTFKHPIFGVGPGLFPIAAQDMRRAETGVSGVYLVTHNTYTQMSSETGLPGFIFFTAIVLFCLKFLYSSVRALSREHSELASAARYLLASTVALAIGITFLSVGYGYVLTVFFALVASLHRLVVAKQASPAGSQVAPSLAIQPSALQNPIRLPAKARPVRERIPSYLRSRGILPKKPEPPRNAL